MGAGSEVGAPRGPSSPSPARPAPRTVLSIPAPSTAHSTGTSGTAPPVEERDCPPCSQPFSKAENKK